MAIFYTEAEYSTGLVWTGNLLPICPHMIGGILLFPKALEENVDNIYVQSDNLPVAYASNNVNSTANTARGSLNLTESKEENTEVEKWYRVRKTWVDAKSQKGAYKVLKNAKACADKNDGYSVFDWNGKVVYSSTTLPDQEPMKAYCVSVNINNLNIRKGPGINFDKTGKYTGVGVFTIVDESEGEGASKLGKLKSGAGWISLDYVERI